MRVNIPHPASWTDFANFVRASPRTHRSSTNTAWFSRIIAVECLCAQSLRASDTLAWAFATRIRALTRLLLPFSLRDRTCCALRSLRSARRRNFGELIVLPFDRTANVANPRSIPTSASSGGRGSSVVSTTNDAKYRPAASLMIVTEDGSDGRSRDQATSTSPTFATYSFPFGRFENPLRVSRIVCRLSRRDRNRGAPTLRPFRFPESESNQFR